MTKAKSAAIGKQEARDAGADLLLEKADIQRLSQVLHDGEWYADERMRAWRAYRAMPMPTLEDEAWRRTDIRALRWNEVVPDTLLGNVSRSGSNGRVPARFKKPLVSRKQGGQIIVANGQIVERTLDDEAAEQGVLFTDLLAATRTHPGQVARHIGKLVPSRDGKHAAMAAALADQGVFVLVPAGVVLKRPLHSVLWSNGLAQFSRVVVIVEQGASLTFVHELCSRAMKKEQLHAGTVEVFVGDGAELTFVELQTLGDSCWHFSHERARVGVEGNLDWIFGSVGSKLTKAFLDLDLAGRGARGRMSGFYFTAGKQHLDHDTQQNHFAEGQTSDLLFKP